MASSNGQGISTSRDSNLSAAVQQTVSASNSTTNLWIGQRRMSAWMDPSASSQRPLPPRLTNPRRVASTPSTATTTSTISLPPTTAIPAQLAQAQYHVPPAETILPSPAPSDEPSPRAQNVHPSPPTIHALSNECRTVAPTTEARFVPIEASVPQSSFNGDAAGLPSPRPTMSVTPSVSTSQIASPAHSPNNNAAATPSFPPSQLLNMQNLQYTPQVTARPPAKRPRTNEPDHRTSQGLQVIRHIGAAEHMRMYIHSIGGIDQLDISIERPRFNLINEACNQGDIFFLILHQLFCLWSVDPAEARQICQEHQPNISSMESAPDILEKILRSNTSLNPARLQFLSRYPVPLAHCRQSPWCTTTLKEVTSFMVRLSAHWEMQISQHVEEGYPLLMSELLGGFLLYSPVLQMIAFRASRRSICHLDESIGAQMDLLFQEDQLVHQDVHNPIWQSPSNRAEYNNRLVQKYRDLIRRQQYIIQHRQLANRNPTTQQNPGRSARVPALGSLPQVYTSEPTQVSPPNNSAYVPSWNISQLGNTAQQLNSQPSSIDPSQESVVQQQRQSIPVLQTGGLHPQIARPFVPTQLPTVMPTMPTRPASTSISASSLTYHNRNVNLHINGHGAQPRDFSQGMTNSASPTPTASTTSSPFMRTRIGIESYPHNPLDRASVENALHQAHLRNPPWVLRTIDTELTAQRHYKAVRSCLVGPSIAPASPLIHKYQFTLSDSNWEKVAKPEKIGDSSYQCMPFSNGTISLRLRCCFIDPEKAVSSEAWAVKDTIWPEHIFVELNSAVVAIKRKAHHSKDLPTDISSLARPGENNLHIFISAHDPRLKGKQPAIAVEVVEVLDHNSVLELIQTRPRIPATTTRETIRRRLGVSSNNSDDLAMAMGDLHVNLADPFSSSIYAIPVRGTECSHLECFDLETWLNTRPRKRSPCICIPQAPDGGQSCKRCQQEPTFADKWKCPLCDGDARPISLIIDDYFVKIRQELETLGKLKAKAILISPEGGWKLKEDSDDDETDRDSAVGNGAQDAIPREVVEID